MVKDESALPGEYVLKLVGPAGIEPATLGLKGPCSTN